MNYEGYKRKFYKKIANASNFTTEKAAEQFYVGMVRVIVDGLREKGRVYLPGLGEFKVGTAHPNWFKNGRMDPNHSMPKTIKFSVSSRFKDFIKSL